MESLFSQLDSPLERTSTPKQRKKSKPYEYKTGSVLSVSYWMAKGLSEVEAQEQISCSQKSRTLKRSRESYYGIAVGSKLPIPEIGSVQGRLMVMSDPFKKGKLYYVSVKCNCGKEYPVPLHRLTGVTKPRLNSCHACSGLRGGTNPKWSGYGDMPGSKYAPIRFRAQKIKHLAQGTDPIITIQECYDLMEAQDRKCALSGVQLDWKNASLDRIDSRRGYAVGNVQWAHKVVNYMKRTLSDEELIEWCTRIVNYQVTNRTKET